MPSLLAVDMGLRTGLALFRDDGRLAWYRSRHYGTRDQLRRHVHRLLAETPDLAWLVVEGGGPIAEIWVREAQRRGVAVRTIGAEVWRECLLRPRDRRTGGQSKLSADALARQVINWSDAPRPTSLRHDAAEAILVGLWAVLDLGWLDNLPRVTGTPASRRSSLAPAPAPRS